MNALSLLNLLDEAMHPRTRVPLNNAVLAVAGWIAYGLVMLDLGFLGSALTSGLAALGWVWIAKRKSVPSGPDFPLLAGLSRLSREAQRAIAHTRPKR